MRARVAAGAAPVHERGLVGADVFPGVGAVGHVVLGGRAWVAELEGGLVCCMMGEGIGVRDERGVE